MKLATIGLRRFRAPALAGLLPFLPLCLGGCELPRATTGEQLARFNTAGPAVPTISLGELPVAKPFAWPYRVVARDVLEVKIEARQDGAEWVAQLRPEQKDAVSHDGPAPPEKRLDMYRVRSGDVIDLAMPTVMHGLGEDGGRIPSYACRVSAAGSIWLPAVGELPVAGKTLPETEAAVVAAYFPKFVKNRPSVIARVTERGTSLLSAVVGGAAPGGRESPAGTTLLCRVTDAGVVRLPVVGDVPVAGKGVSEIEETVAAAYHPKHVGSPPTVMVKVAEYCTATVYAAGAVGSPGRYELRSNEMELAVLLAKAGGIGGSARTSGAGAGGAKIIRIRRAGQAHDAKPLEVPVRDRNIPLVNVALQDGDSVEVEHYEDPLFTVTGLVMSPGVHSYPPTARYTLQQALAMSGGTDLQAGPRHATIYRQDRDGRPVVAQFPIGGMTMIEALDVVIKPGDVICLEPNFRTRWNKFWARVLHFGAGAYATVPLVPSTTR